MWEEKDESDAIARNSNISICLLIRKGKEGQLRKKKVRTQLQEVLREIEEIIQKSKYIKSVRHWFVYLEQIGLRTGFHGAIEMLNQFIHFTIPGQLGNEPIYSWVEQTGGGKLQVKYRVQLGFRPRIQ